MLRKYYGFINESEESISMESLEEAKDKLVDALGKYQNHLLAKISWKDNKVFYKDFDNIDVAKVLGELEKNIGIEYTTSFNLESFLRKIHQILDLQQKSTKRNIRDEFIEYYISLDKRIETLGDGEDAPTNYKLYHNSKDGETSLLSRDQYESEKYDIQVELLKLQEWVKRTGQRIAIVFEGRDTAGKGSSIKRFVEYLDPKSYKIVALDVPTEEEKNDWFGRYEKYLPNAGEIVFFDRSWYNKAVVEPAMGYCTESQYKEFMTDVVEWEEGLIKEGIILIKFWFSITKEKQQKRFELRKQSPLKYWKFSPNDAKAVNKWDLITYYKNQMFNNTSTTKSPWVVINSNDKRIARLNAMRYVLNVIDYDDKIDDISEYYPEVVNILK